MKRLLMLSLCTLLMACVGEENIYHEYECYFLFDTFLHPVPCQLTAAISSNGAFMKVETRVEQGVRHLKTIRNYDNATEDIRLTTDRETRLNYALGANNCIIVGVSSYDNVLVAYYPVNESDSTYEGLVRMETTKMRLLMEHKKLISIWTPKAQGVMYPMTQIPPDKKFLEGFHWFDYVRPMSRDDIFEWRPKKPGTEIKTIRRSNGASRKVNTLANE